MAQDTPLTVMRPFCQCPCSMYLPTCVQVHELNLRYVYTLYPIQRNILRRRCSFHSFLRVIFKVPFLPLTNFEGGNTLCPPFVQFTRRFQALVCTCAFCIRKYSYEGTCTYEDTTYVRRTYCNTYYASRLPI